MPNFRYNATDPAGKWISGEVEGPSLDEVEARLRGDGLRVENLTEADEEHPGRSSKASDREMVELIEQLASLTRSGLPLPSGLRAVGEEMVSPTLRAMFLELADKIESGVELDLALASSGRRFPPHLRSLILAGARSGRMADVLGEYVRSANLGSELRRVFWSTLAYPVFALVVVLALVGFVCSISNKAIEMMIGSLPDFGQRKSGAVEALTVMARFITDHGLELVLGLLAIPVVAWLTLRFLFGPARRRQILCGIPVLGPILRYASLTEFCHLLAMLIEADLPLPLALELAGQGVRDAEVAEATGRMRRAVEGGEPLSGAVLLWKSIPAGLGQLFYWSEGHRNLPEALHLAGDMFESRARSQSGFASVVLATFLLLLILWWVGFAVATLYLPMLSLIERLSG
jgi:type II secretory pathway component PulF